METIQIKLVDDGMGEGSTREDAEAYRDFVERRLTAIYPGADLSVELLRSGEVTAHTVAVDETEAQDVSDVMASLWEEFCADTALWPSTRATTTTAKVILIKVESDGSKSDSDGTGEVYEVRALLHPDGRLFALGAGVDGGDSLFGSLDEYEPNGLDRVQSIEVTEETAPLSLAALASGDVDNCVYDRSLLTDAERAALIADVDDQSGQSERWRRAAGIEIED